jgi:pilus assembly protein CpaB
LIVGTVAAQSIYAGEQIISEKLATEDRDAGLPSRLEPGTRGMGVEVNTVVGAGGLLRPGDRVDIVAVLDVEHTDVTTGREFTETRAFTLAQNIEVMAIADALVNKVPTGDDGPASTDQPEADPDAQVATLAVTPQEAQNLLLADERGDIRLIVRAVGDNEIIDLPNSTYIDLADPEFAELLRQALSRPE